MNMTPQFHVGEIVIAVNDETMTPELQHLRYTGEECTVVAVFKNHTMQTNDGWEIFPIAYRVWFGDTKLLDAAPHELRKKEPPKNEVKSSDDDWARAKIRELIEAHPLITIEEMVNV